MNEMKLYDYSEQYQNLLSLVDSEDGYTYEDLKDTLDSIAEAAEDKIANIGKVLRRLNDELLIIDNREKEIKELKAKKKRDIENLKEYLLIHMTQLDKKKVQTPTITVSTRNSKAMNIKDESKLPEEFIKTEIKTSPKKADFKKYYESLSVEEQEKIDYAEIVVNKSIQIK
ncbi:siphovirus Gp157 family protein [Mammaliicoccus sciuri]|uniref:siphovirus Gp157 family protein n=1 Tax=Mammaliicoccus sciuri TaxID=1296 RepID=UPI001C62956B|nr:siphovirus Gp157 family protein [Mammaliicoccus sciuri]QYG30108.1 siphovirus Gp157 family protein [Mammaliicoccus sciuri]